MDRATDDESPSTATEARWKPTVRRIGGAVRRFCERRVGETGRRRSCVSCGEPIVTEPTESSLECPECAHGAGNGEN